MANQVQLDWDAVTEDTGDNTVTTPVVYRIERAVDTGQYVAFASSLTATMHTDATVVQPAANLRTTYHYRLRAETTGILASAWASAQAVLSGPVELSLDVPDDLLSVQVGGSAKQEMCEVEPATATLTVTSSNATIATARIVDRAQGSGAFAVQVVGVANGRATITVTATQGAIMQTASFEADVSGGATSVTLDRPLVKLQRGATEIVTATARGLGTNPTWSLVDGSPTWVAIESLGGGRARITVRPQSATPLGTVSYTVRATNPSNSNTADAVGQVKVIRPPIVNIGVGAQTIDGGDALTLTATVTSAVGYSVLWTDDFSGTFADATARNTTWTAPTPAATTTYSLVLTATDVDGLTGTDSVEIRVRGSANVPVIRFNRSPDQNRVNSGDTVNLMPTLTSTTGGGSYSWSVRALSTGAPTASSPAPTSGIYSDGINNITASWVAPSPRGDATYRLTLTATDSDQPFVGTGSVDIIVAADLVPSVSAPSFTAQRGATTSRQATATDFSATPTWTLVSGPSFVTVSSDGQVTASPGQSDRLGDYNYTVRATAGTDNATGTGTVTVAVEPTITVPRIQVQQGQTGRAQSVASDFPSPPTWRLDPGTLFATFVTVTPSGLVSASPDINARVGQHLYSITATGGGVSATTLGYVDVLDRCDGLSISIDTIANIGPLAPGTTRTVAVAATTVVDSNPTYTIRRIAGGTDTTGQITASISGDVISINVGTSVTGPITARFEVTGTVRCGTNMDTDTEAFEVSAAPVNRAPTITASPSSVDVQVGGTANVNLDAMDADADPVDITARISPASSNVTIKLGARTTTGSGNVRRVLTVTGVSTGSATIIATATDDEGLSGFTSIGVTIRAAGGSGTSTASESLALSHTPFLSSDAPQIGSPLPYYIGPAVYEVTASSEQAVDLGLLWDNAEGYIIRADRVGEVGSWRVDNAAQNRILLTAPAIGSLTMGISAHDGAGGVVSAIITFSTR